MTTYTNPMGHLFGKRASVAAILLASVVLAGCNDDSSNTANPSTGQSSAASPADTSSTWPPPLTPTPVVIPSADLTVESPDGYTLGITIDFNAPTTESGDSLPEECSAFAEASLGIPVAARVLPVDITVTDTTTGGFSWPANDTLVVSNDQMFGSPFRTWLFCDGDEDDKRQIKLEVGSSHHDYLIWASQVTPAEPKGNFYGMHRVELGMAMTWTYDADGRNLTPTDCPDAPDPCVLSPAVD